MDKRFVCPQCGKEGLPQNASSCIDCYFAEWSRKRAAAAAATLSRPWVQGLFNRFVVQRFERTKQAKNVGRLIPNQVGVFRVIEQQFARPVELTSEALLGCLGRNRFSGNHVIVDFLVEELVIAPLSETAMDELGEKQCRERLLARVGVKWQRDILHRYEEYLEHRRQRFLERGWRGESERFVPRSITLNVRAAKRFLEALPAAAISPSAITQEHLDTFLAASEGQKNALRTFLVFLNEKRHRFGKLKLSRPGPRQAPVHNFLSVDRSNELLRAWLAVSPGETREALIGLLMLLYARTAKQAAGLRLDDFVKGPDGKWRTKFGADWLTIDERVGQVMDRYLEQREHELRRHGRHSVFLFPGRAAGSHLSPSTLGPYLRKLGVTAEELFATSIINAYRNGLRYPKSLVRALGVSLPTAVNYYAQMDSQAAKVYAKRTKRTA